MVQIELCWDRILGGTEYSPAVGFQIMFAFQEPCGMQVNAERSPIILVAVFKVLDHPGEHIFHRIFWPAIANKWLAHPNEVIPLRSIHYSLTV